MRARVTFDSTLHKSAEIQAEPRPHRYRTRSRGSVAQAAQACPHRRPRGTSRPGVPARRGRWADDASEVFDFLEQPGGALKRHVVLHAGGQLGSAGVPSPAPSVFSKAYTETVAKARLHQPHFRKETLAAYAGRCCVCELRERPLLDAAHIVSDRLPEGVAWVRNGLAMCPTHHRAYDQNILVVTENYRVEVREDRLGHVGSEATRRMLLDYHGREIVRPKDEQFWPEPGLLRRKIELAA